MPSLIASLNVVELSRGDRIVFEAIDPVSGAPVGGVLVVNAAISNDSPSEPPPEPLPNPEPVLATVPNAKLASDLPG